MDDKLVRMSDVKDLFHQGDEKTFPFSAPGLVTERDIDSIPAVDAVEVVRCRECVNWRRYENSPADCDLNMMRMGPEDYCSYGQRREDGDESVCSDRVT